MFVGKEIRLDRCNLIDKWIEIFAFCFCFFSVIATVLRVCCALKKIKSFRLHLGQFFFFHFALFLFVLSTL